MDKILKNGILFAFLTAIISGFAIFFSGFAVKIIKDPFVLTSSRNIIAAFILCALLSGFKNRQALKALSRRDWLNLVLIGIVGGSIPFLLFFKGLSMSSPLIGGFIHKTIFIWVSLLAVIFLREKIGKVQWLALGILLLGNYLLGAFQFFKFGLP
ncbi:MAG: DMT family transporter, partial [bacterium]|nr:DMT family transporter [bacterium]